MGTYFIAYALSCMYSPCSITRRGISLTIDSWANRFVHRQRSPFTLSPFRCQEGYLIDSQIWVQYHRDKSLSTNRGVHSTDLTINKGLPFSLFLALTFQVPGGYLMARWPCCLLFRQKILKPNIRLLFWPAG